ncbi:MAG: tetratricopeptide repeat protein, partial [Pseudomonadota bacterium]
MASLKSNPVLGQTNKTKDDHVQHIYQLITQGKTHQAFTLIDQLDLTQAPVALMLKGLNHYHNGDLKQAISILQQCTEQYPNFSPAYNNLGTIQNKIGRFNQSYQLFTQALQLEPNNLSVSINLIMVCTKLRRYSEALQRLKDALKKWPLNYSLAVQASNIYSNLARHDLALKYAKIALTKAPLNRSCAVTRLFNGTYMMSDSRSDHYVNARRWAKRIEERIERVKQKINIDLAPLPNHNEIIRIGYLSADFRRHAGIYTTRKTLPNHNRKRFEVHCIYNHVIFDRETEALKTKVDGWHNIFGKNDLEATLAIRKLKLHILIDLSVSTDGGRPELIALRLAPVQMSWMHFDTSALQEMDYWLTHPYLNPASIQPLSSEKIIYLDHGALPFDPPEIERPKRLSTMQRYPKNHIIFGMFNNWRKANDHCLQA